ncbi:MAG: HlyD family efflux transporter periplasmic adaptor subunit [Paracoccaceae bacterium]
MRFSRLVIGVLVIFAALWVIVSEQMAGASANAVVNAQVIVVRTPIAGTIKDADRGLGTAVSANDTLATVTDPTPDTIQLDDLILQRSIAEIRRGGLQAQAALLDGALEKLATRSAQYKDYSLRELSAHVVEAQERLRLLSADGAEADAMRISLAREELARLQVVSDAAQNGVFIAGGFNDAPFSEQRSAQIEQSMHDLKAGVEIASAEIAAMNRRIDQERIRVGRLGAATIASPTGGIIWERLAVTGSHVERGDAVLRLADCSNVFVTLSVTQPVFNRLQAGATATFRFDQSGVVLKGIVARLAGTSAASFYGSLAVAPSERHLERADVLLTLPTLSNHPELRCAIGQTGRAFFEVRPFDWLRSYFG